MRKLKLTKKQAADLYNRIVHKQMEKKFPLSNKVKASR